MSNSGDDRPAFAAERHERILRLLAENGRVRTVHLATELDVAEPTVRKDIIELASQGRLRRTYGGALAVTSTLVEPTIATRSTRHVDAKKRIAAVALKMIGTGESVYLDNGTTVLALVNALAEAPPASRPRNLNVLTNGIEVAQSLSEVGGVTHVLLGGSYRAAGNALTGPLTLDSLQQFSVSTAFIGVSGLAQGAFTVADITEAQVKSAVITRSSRIVVLMDSSKIGASDFARVCSLDAVQCLVTDRGGRELARQCADAGVELLTA